MADKTFPTSQLPIRRTVDLLPQIFQTEANAKFFAASVDPLVQPGALQKTVGYVGRRFGKTYKSADVYLDDEQTLRSRYQLEPGLVVEKNGKVEDFYDYLDFKNQLKFLNNNEERDDIVTDQEHYTWNPPIDWDKFINYREYYWIPDGPPAIKILGQAQNIVSTYRVGLGVGSVYLFTPDGLTNNPTLTLYRGQTYKFQVNVPGNPLLFRTNIDTGTLLYNPDFSYVLNSLVVFDNKLWRAKNNITPGDGSSIDEDTQDWELVEVMSATASALNYTRGVSNAGVEKGTITFAVPLNAPDVLYYQSLTEPNRFGRFLISDIEENTKIEVEKEIIGKANYVSSNGVEFGNGMVVRFGGQVFPKKYADENNSKWIVEGVGQRITLTNVADLIVSTTFSTASPEILFDNGGFDTQPFDDASAYPGMKDYITINKSSIDSNPWSRYNRWVHRAVLDYAHGLNNSNFDADESARAKRPIIEFQPNIQLYNHAAVARPAVDYVDDFTTDVFTSIEGSAGYIVDGENLFAGARLLITNDTDSLANNQVYVVNFITHNNRRQISLIRESSAATLPGDGVLIRRGVKNRGIMYHFTGLDWVISQLKNKVNQPPLFDLFDSEGTSFGDNGSYGVSSFVGTPIVSFKIGQGPADAELGFGISYLNIANVGDIQFDFNLDTDVFDYKIDNANNRRKLATGFYKYNSDNSFANAWITLDRTVAQPIVDTVNVITDTVQIETTMVDWQLLSETDIDQVLVYVNGTHIRSGFTRTLGLFVFDQGLSAGDSVTIKLFAAIDPDTGYYEIPLGLEKNPFNSAIQTFTLGQAADHLSTGIELTQEFAGVFLGANNLRNISGYQNRTKRFLKHSSPAPLSMALLCSKQNNIVKSIQHAKKSYTDFKNSFVALAYELYFDQTTNDFVDSILQQISQTQDSSRSFFASDMIGNGAYVAIDYVVEDTGITTFALSEKFDLQTLSAKAVYVYVNDQQLLAGNDYEFNSVFGFVNLKIVLTEGAKIQIREYVSTANNFIPPTPTKLGLYKKYTPKIFVDNTFVEPKTVIQGHDGSITVAYGDFRDDVLLELEYRIYNNIKQEYDESVFDIDAVLGGYYGNALYTKSQLDNIIVPEFLKWISGTDIDYVRNTFFDRQNSFTYTYSNMVDPSGTKNLPGYWKGVYYWFYDTYRPHTCPWEMLGFSQEPAWWQSEYGAAPYTSNNLLLWEDLRDGIIRQGNRAGIKLRYQRASIMSHIPVDGDGNLLSPLDAGLASNFSLVNNQGDFKLGDFGPVEAAWRSSSEWPFAVINALALLKPFEYITDNFNKSNIATNQLGQTINTLTNLFPTLSDLIYENKAETPVSGLVTYVVNYLKSTAALASTLPDLVGNLDVKLSSRISGFVDQQQQKYILDSKNPSSTSSSVFVPPENYDIIFNVSSPIFNLAYSGVIIEKVNGGVKISGYDSIVPSFNYYQSTNSQSDPLIQVGGISENFLDWNEEKFYGNGVIARYRDRFYRCLASHTSGTEFLETSIGTALWKQLPALPFTGAVEAFRRRNFNKLRVKTLSYGTVLNSVQQVVDFLLGYQEYLQSVGFVFDGYDAVNSAARDWFTAAKEYMFWTKHNWAESSLLTLSPAAINVKVQFQVGAVDNILDSFYDYQILKNDGAPLQPRFINVNREFQQVQVSTTNTTDGIYFIRLNFVLKEHVVVFDDRTVFNDVLYDKPTGYRQERIKSRGFRTVDWDGDYTSPGFIFDNVDIQVWQPFSDYKLGDIVAYKSYNWTSKRNQLGSAEFQDSSWSRLDSTPVKSLVPNFDYRINQFADYYEVNTDGVGTSQRDLARHAIGYQPRAYLQNIAEDEISQFRIYQGFIREKGTANAIVKVFDKLSNIADDSVVLKEEWAFKVGELGGTDQKTEIEFEINKDDFKLNPQPILITYGPAGNIVLDQYVRINSTKFTLSPTVFDTDINPVSYYTGQNRSAGYVNTNHIAFVVKNLNDITNINIFSVFENDHIWITFFNNSWTVLRYNQQPALQVIRINKTDDQVELTLNRLHSFAVNDIVGLKYISNLTGFFTITAVSRLTITVITTVAEEPEITDSTSATVGMFTVARKSNYQSLDQQQAALLDLGAKVWVDNNGQDQWEVIEKTKQYKTFELSEYGITAPLRTGAAVVYIDTLKQIAAGMPGSGYVMIYTTKTSGQVIGLKQIVPPPDGFETAVLGSFGKVLATSPDYKWLVVGSPNASGVKSGYLGTLDPAVSYLAGETVLYQGKLWEAVDNISVGDGSSINFNSADWKPATIVNANAIGRGNGFTNQGMISLYKFQNGQWEIITSLVSPRQANYEEFGSSISIGVVGTKYYMAVSAVGSLCDPSVGSSTGKGRVYLYLYNGTEWQHLENTNYQGLYQPSALAFYPAGSIVWSQDSLWQALYDNTGDGSTLSMESNDWRKLDDVSTQCSLPTNVALDDDGSTLALGLLSSTQLAELVKDGDQFGFSLTMSRDASVLVVGSPNSDGQYFANYRGNWNFYQEYREDDVVKYQGGYHRLTDPDSATSSITSLGQYPDDGLPWTNVGDSASPSTGKIYIYQRGTNDLYSLVQTITAENLIDINDDVNSANIASGDQFGFAVDIDAAGTTLVATSPMADLQKQNQGAAYIFKYTADSTVSQFRLSQKIRSFEFFTNEYFGSSVSISAATERIVIGAKNAQYSVNAFFLDGTTFDRGRTQFYTPKGFPGQVYVYERKDQGYFLVEKLQADFVTGESFGHAVDCTSSVIVVGSPTYSLEGIPVGMVRLFQKSATANSFNAIAQQSPSVDLDLLQNIELYDNVNNVKIQDVDVVDGFKLKILGIAEQEISYKAVYDPAIYMLGTDQQVIDQSQAWFEKNLGKIWWDLSTVKYLDYEQEDVSYRVGNWNTQVQGSTIDVYEWVASPLLPSEWSILADTTEGLVEEISGQPKFADDTVYNTKVLLNPNTGLPTSTMHYYWVKNKSTVPRNTPGRRIAAAAVSNLISSPIGSSVPFVGIIAADKFLAYNFKSVISTNTALLNIEYLKTKTQLNAVHREYQLLTSGVADSLPAEYLEKKWIDSLVGSDESGQSVPDLKLPRKKQLGLNFRPRQSMFVDRDKALKITIENINSVLQTQPFADTIDFVNLNRTDPIPSAELNQYDADVDSIIDLEQVGTVKIKQAVFKANIINGQIDTIDIVDAGFGYRVTPFIQIQGDGFGARAEITLGTQGKVNAITVTSRGRKYTTATIIIRPFSVLVRSDSSLLGRWSIYSWDQQRKIFYRSRSQGFDTTVYWQFVDWWQSGYNSNARIVKEIVNIYQEPTLDLQVGDLVRIREYGNGGWAVLEKTQLGLGNLLNNYNLVGRNRGTISIKDTLYNRLTTSLGFDNVGAYDAAFYDLQPNKELRIILQAAKEDIFVADLSVEWNKLFFTAVKYAFSEQTYIDWAFKTSFLNAVHNVGSLEQKTNYKNDNLESFQSYIEEVKPYRTSIREYTSRYTNIDAANQGVSDFDLPPAYSVRDGAILPVNQYYNRFDEYPWKLWADNNGFGIVQIAVADAGADYTSPPQVLITGNGQGATATAFISNGRVSAIKVVSQGQGYTQTPIISLVGGNGASTSVAKAVPVLGASQVRSFDLTMKFDRVSKTASWDEFNYSQTFVATGFSAVFELNFAPTEDKSKITVTKNNELVITDRYQINLYTVNVGYTLLKGRIRFFANPTAGDVIVVQYEKNSQLFDSVDRINRFYQPSSGMKGNELSQLMTGIDFGGVQVQGTTFDVTGGWDALPWFTDSWDSVDSSNDFYYRADGSTTFVVLPYTPDANQPISIYIKRFGTDTAVRIDDPAYTPAWDSSVATNPHAEMPTWIGDGSSNIIEIHRYLSTNDGDTLIFRKLDSDGSVTIIDVNLLDTRISGGTLASNAAGYTTAAGFTPEEIVLDGEKFVSPDQVPAPEENVPGQVLDSLSIKVFNKTNPGAAAIQNNVLVADGTTKRYSIGLTIFEATSVMVYVNKVKQEYIGDSTVNYVIDFVQNQVEFNLAPVAGALVEIIAVGIGGIGLLDYQEFVADGETNLFLTKAAYDQTSTVLVTVDGVALDVGYVNSTDFIDAQNKTMIQFGLTPEYRQVVKIICFSAIEGADSLNDAFVRINQQTQPFDGSTRTIQVDNFVNLEQSSEAASILVSVNGVFLQGIDTTYVVFDGSNNNISVGVDPEEAIGTITSGNVRVYVNEVRQQFVIDFTYNGNNNLITIPAVQLAIGDIIRIETNVRAQYTVSGSSLTLAADVPLSINDDIEIVWFSQYPTMNMVADEYQGGRLQYKLARTPLDINYVWVYKNGVRLAKDADYRMPGTNIVYLTESSTPADIIKIVQFSSVIYRSNRAFEIYKDMLNNVHYKRFSINKQVVLAGQLNYFDDTVTVSSGDQLATPIYSRRIPGVIVINNERIEYFEKNGNVLSQLRRGSLGTAIAETHASGSVVVDVGANETLPYSEAQEKTNFISDGSTQLIGPLEFTPLQGTRNSWARQTIPVAYGACDSVEVFVGGRRLRKNPIDVYDPENGASSPSADTQQEAEFSVSGASPYVRLTTAVPAGTRITVIRKQGKIWYEKSDIAASQGITLLSNNTPIANFIAAKTTELPE